MAYNQVIEIIADASQSYGYVCDYMGMANELFQAPYHSASPNSLPFLPPHDCERAASGSEDPPHLHDRALTP